MICIEAHCAFTTVETLERATFHDGLFHAAMWLVLLAGLALLPRAVSLSGGLPRPRFWGSILLGAGIFNGIEGIVDHHLLQIHHVRFGPGMASWDLGFLVLSALVAGIGWRKLRSPS